MVKAPSSHGLDRKYRSWRKGKSAKAKKQGSLKHQLRGQERLLAQVLKRNEDQGRIQELQQRIQAIKDEVAEKESKEVVRQNSKRSHGTRFLDRQRATRLERTARNAKNTQELTRIALDMIYVAHFPHQQQSYRPLYRNGKKRWLIHPVSRAMIRQKIIQDLKENNKNSFERVKWISQDMYERVPSEWSVAQELELFDYPKGDGKDKKKETTQDNRFAISSDHDKFLEMANQLESKLDKDVPQKKKEETSDSDSSSDDDEEEPKKASGKRPPKDPSKRQREEDGSDDSSSSSDSDSSEDISKSAAPSTKENQTTKPMNKEPESSSSSDSDSSSDSSSDDSSSDDEDQKVTSNRNNNDNKNNPLKKVGPDKNKQEEKDSDSDDDFFVAASAKKDEDIAVFDRVQGKEEHMLAAEDPARGDKSQGWATQRQRPGQFKKKRVRR
ncbi:expressed unknown protein [Seminavis robusta]|uniref:Uncharacterized protein n=1 Tax=Seminavis robusta TaxID=568900 RepID=A0A9N8DEW2_9STRA|nr:expressed unknown protein [Seminavis robusta]|eukprot:Sro61_g035220.1 n/a (441) ;mRNA; r:130470-131792